MKNTALEYARAGFPITPLQGQESFEPTKDVVIVEYVWSHFPDTNIGLEFGPHTGISALLVNPYEGGLKSFGALIKGKGPLPRTPQLEGLDSRKMYLFRYHASFIIPYRFRKGLEVKNDGMVLLPPSIPISGTKYFWKKDHELGNLPLAGIPEWLVMKPGRWYRG